MSAVTCPSDPPPPYPLVATRARGEIRASFKRYGDRTSIAGLREGGGLRMKFPNAAGGCEAVLVNTAGGVAGGDKALVDIELAETADVTVTTQSAEKIHRSDGAAAEIDVSMRVAAGARLEWLPQETILFEGARLARRLDVDLDGQASLLLLECVVYGRLAMGEHGLRGSFRDRWRVRRDRRLIFAEEARLDGDIGATLGRPAVGAGARATAALLYVVDAPEALADRVRSLLADAPCEWGVSAWNGFALARFLSPSPETVRAAIVPVLRELRGRDAPRVWQ
jgi:urease accessory protein